MHILAESINNGEYIRNALTTISVWYALKELIKKEDYAQNAALKKQRATRNGIMEKYKNLKLLTNN